VADGAALDSDDHFDSKISSRVQWCK
jgi:hypothetical protein